MQTLTMKTRIVQGRRILCQHCDRPHNYLVTHEVTARRYAVSDDDVTELVQDANAEIRAHILSFSTARTQGIALCPHCKMYQLFMLRSLRRERLREVGAALLVIGVPTSVLLVVLIGILGRTATHTAYVLGAYGLISAAALLVAALRRVSPGPHPRRAHPGSLTDEGLEALLRRAEQRGSDPFILWAMEAEAWPAPSESDTDPKPHSLGLLDLTDREDAPSVSSEQAKRRSPSLSDGPMMREGRLEEGSRSGEGVVRFFISSTFRDMQADRDALVKYAFPQLRALCEGRGVVWGEVDLRWGITDEELAEGRMLPVCMEEIHDCRPYFIGLLGERYGWVPDEIPEDLCEREPWLDELEGRSVTELEILHGALNRPTMDDRARFYFRDPAYLERLPEGEDPADYGAETPDAAAKLRALKQKIRESGLPLREDYADPEALASMVLEDVTAVIEKRFPSGDVKAPAQEARLHAVFQEHMCRVYVGGEQYEARLQQHMVSDEPPLIVTGPPGAGKSALLAHWADTVQRGLHACGVPGGVVAHYSRASPRGGGWALTLQRVTAEVAARASMPLPDPLPGPGSLPDLLVRVLTDATADQRMLLVLDGADELDSEAGFAWLPDSLPASARVVLSVEAGPCVAVLRERGWPVLELQALTVEERRRFIVEYLAMYRKRLPTSQIERLASVEPASNPLYLRTLLEELRLLGRHEELGARIEGYLEAADVPCLMERVLQRYEEDYEHGSPGLVAEVFSLALGSRSGLSEGELRCLAAGGDPDVLLPQATWSPLRLASRHFFLERSGKLVYACTPFRQAVERRYLRRWEDLQRVHLKLADFFAHRFEKTRMGASVWEVMAACGRPVLDWRRLEELPYQLAEAGRWQALAELLADPYFLRDAWHANSADLRHMWRRLEAATSIERTSAYREAIENPSRFADVLRPISVLLWEGGHTEEALRVAEEEVRILKARGDRLEAIRAVELQAHLLCDLGKLQEAVDRMNSLEEEQDCIEDVGERARSLTSRAAIDARRGAWTEAQRELEEAAGRAAAAGDERTEVTALVNLATVRQRLGQTDESLALVEDVEPRVRLLGDPMLLAGCYQIRARVSEERGDLEAALEWATQSEGIFRQAGFAQGIATQLQNRAEVCRRLERLDEALQLLAEKEALCRETGDDGRLARCLSLRAQILLAQDEVDAAWPALQEMESLYRKIGGDAYARSSLLNVVEMLRDAGEFERILDLLRWRRGCATCADDPQLDAELCCLQGAVLARELGRIDEGLVFLEESQALFEQLGLAELAAHAKRIREETASHPRGSGPEANHPASDEAIGEWRYARGLEHLERGELEEAETEMRSSLKVGPGRPERHNALGVVYKRSGRLVDAARAFEKALAIDPKHYASTQNLQTIRNVAKYTREEEIQTALRKVSDLAERTVSFDGIEVRVAAEARHVTFLFNDHGPVGSRSPAPPAPGIVVAGLPLDLSSDSEGQVKYKVLESAEGWTIEVVMMNGEAEERLATLTTIPEPDVDSDERVTRIVLGDPSLVMKFVKQVSSLKRVFKVRSYQSDRGRIVLAAAGHTTGTEGEIRVVDTGQAVDYYIEARSGRVLLGEESRAAREAGDTIGP